MKRLIYIFVAMLMVVTTSCKKETPATNVDNGAKLVGEWHCTPEQMDVDIYVEFCNDSTFNLYQKIGEGRHRCYSGTWSVKKNTLSGTYTDGTVWGSSYTIAFTDSNNMTLTAENGSNEVMTYVRESIPSDIIDGSITTRSAEESEAKPIL